MWKQLMLSFGLYDQSEPGWPSHTSFITFIGIDLFCLVIVIARLMLSVDLVMKY